MNTSYSATALATATIPEEGPKTIPFVFDFSQQATYPADLQNLQGRNFFSAAQSVFIDNSLNAAAVSITFDGTQQKVTAKPYTQGYYTVLCPNPIRFLAASTGAVVVRVYLLNVPVAGAVWSTQ